MYNFFLCIYILVVFCILGLKVLHGLINQSINQSIINLSLSLSISISISFSLASFLFYLGKGVVQQFKQIEVENLVLFSSPSLLLYGGYMILGSAGTSLIADFTLSIRQSLFKCWWTIETIMNESEQSTISTSHRFRHNENRSVLVLESWCAFTCVT